jgi:hypothetical protein
MLMKFTCGNKVVGTVQYETHEKSGYKTWYVLLTGNFSDVAVFSRINFRLLHVEDLAVYTAF